MEPKERGICILVVGAAWAIEAEKNGAYLGTGGFSGIGAPVVRPSSHFSSELRVALLP